jgi:hypothetical protein
VTDPSALEDTLSRILERGMEYSIQSHPSWTPALRWQLPIVDSSFNGRETMDGMAWVS